MHRALLIRTFTHMVGSRPFVKRDTYVLRNRRYLPLKAAIMEPDESRGNGSGTMAMRRQLEALFKVQTVRGDFDGNALRDVVKGRRLNLIIRNEEICLEVQSIHWDTYSIIWEGMAEIINDYGAIDNVVRAMALYEGWQSQNPNAHLDQDPVVIPLDIHVSFLRDMPSYPDF